MKIGLLARCDRRGIAYQTHEFWSHMKPHRTLVIRMNNPLHPEDISMYPGKGVAFIDVQPDRVMDERIVRRFLHEIDVLFAVETLMDWRVAVWAKEMGVRTVVQGNPEFADHHHSPGRPHPDLWLWPTDWMIKDLPKGEILPVPAPDQRPLAADPSAEPLKVLHVAGLAATGDRNGTVDFMNALARVTQPVHVTVVGQDHWLPEANPSRNITLTLNAKGVEDRWDLYRDQHVVVLPRRYGGLSLPSNEACAAGLAIIHPDCSPNEHWPGFKLPARRARLHRAPFGAIQTHSTDPVYIARAIDQLSKNREMLGRLQSESRAWAFRNSWTALKPRYLEVLAG